MPDDDVEIQRDHYVALKLQAAASVTENLALT